MELAQLCKDLIAIPSVTVPQGTKELVAFLKPRFEVLGFRTKTQEFLIEGHPNENLLASIGPEASDRPLLINTHLDTVSPGPACEKTWTQCQGNPFQATERNGMLYGLGTADTKLAMACVLTAAQRVLARSQAQAFRQTLHILGTAGEEKGLLGARHAMETGFVRAHYAVDSEPSNLHVVWAHKGFCVCRIQMSLRKEVPETKMGDKAIAISFQGEPAHSSTPHLGRNALAHAFSFLDLFFKNKEKWGPNLLTPFWLQGGNLTNVIPAHAVIYFHGLISPQKFIEALHPQEPDIEVKEVTFSTGHPSFMLPESLLRAATYFHHLVERFAEEVKGPERPEFSPPSATSSLTLATPQNLAGKPGLILFQDHRFMELDAGKTFISRLHELATQTNERFEQVACHVDLEREDLPLVGKSDAPFVREIQGILREIGLTGQLATKSGCTEATLFARYGMETIVIGPGTAENNIHKPNERVPIEELHKATQFYERLIEKFCL